MAIRSNTVNWGMGIRMELLYPGCLKLFDRLCIERCQLVCLIIPGAVYFLSNISWITERAQLAEYLAY